MKPPFAPMMELGAAPPEKWSVEAADHYLDQLLKAVTDQASSSWSKMRAALDAMSVDTVKAGYEETVQQTFLAVDWAAEDLHQIRQEPAFLALPDHAPERALLAKAAGVLDMLIEGLSLDEPTRKAMKIDGAPVLVPLVVLGVAVALTLAAVAWAVVCWKVAAAFSDWCQGFRDEVQARKAAMEQGKTLPPGTPMVQVPDGGAGVGAGAALAGVVFLAAVAGGFYLILKK